VYHSPDINIPSGRRGSIVVRGVPVRRFPIRSAGLKNNAEIVVDNESIKQNLRNLMETGSLLSNPKISITKLNESPILDARVQVTGESGAGGFQSEGVSLDSQGTISYVWDTNNISPFYTGEKLGSEMGVYEVAVQYDVAEETIVSPRFKLIAR